MKSEKSRKFQLALISLGSWFFVSVICCMLSEVGRNATNKPNRLRDRSENPFAKQKIAAHSPARLPPGKPQNKKIN
jgi:hypothetical protein